MTRLAYLDCASGISGDMTLGALVDAGVALDEISRAIDSLGLIGLKLSATEVRRHSLRATKIHVDCPPEDKHRHLHHIVEMIDRSSLTDRQRATARDVFTRLAEAEARVHGTTIEKVHFHEVGAADSIADIVGAVVGFDLLGVERIVGSPVAVGSGKVTIAHGTVSVPAPATAELLRGIPIASSDVPMELATPTGAALLKVMAQGFGSMPSITIDRIGYGAGTRDVPGSANVLRLIVGQAPSDSLDTPSDVCMVETNLDDESPEVIGYCVSKLWDAGALDVYTTPIQMKKDRPGVKLSVVCRESEAPTIEHLILRETSTLGVRRWPVGRQVLPREPHTVETPWGPVQGKLARLPDGTQRFAPEYDDCRRIAREHGVPLREVYRAAQRGI